MKRRLNLKRDKKKAFYCIESLLLHVCPKRDSNSQGIIQRLLRPQRLPISPSGQGCKDKRVSQKKKIRSLNSLLKDKIGSFCYGFYAKKRFHEAEKLADRLLDNGRRSHEAKSPTGRLQNNGRRSHEAKNPTGRLGFSALWVRMKGLEPPRREAPDPKSGAAAITPHPQI